MNLWHRVLEMKQAMADISIATIMPTGPKKQSHTLKGIEYNYMNGAAIGIGDHVCALCFVAQI